MREFRSAKSKLHYVLVTLINGQLCVDQQVILLFLRFFSFGKIIHNKKMPMEKHARLTVCIVVFMPTYYEWQPQSRRNADDDFRNHLFFEC